MGILEIVLISILNSAVFSSAFFGEYDEYCSSFYCGMMNSTPPFVRYPFKFQNQSKDQCGYPGFDLGCDSGENITLNLPNSGEFYVENIDYYSQGIQLQDPQGCLPGRLLKLLSNSSNSSPFSPFITGDSYNNYTFLACRNDSNIIWDSHLPIIGCLSNSDVFIIASSFSGFAADMPSVCDVIGTVSVPEVHGGADDIAASNFTLSLSWKDPVCLDCVARGGFCRFAGITICTIDNTDSLSQLKRWENFLKIVRFSVFLPLAGLPIFFFIVLLCFGREERRRNLAGNSRGLTFSEMIRQLTVKPGLEDYVIESYPKIVVDERLGNVDDVICCICLDEYVAGEILRSLPECKHYFHVECIDEWLKINRTCPVCRV